jgi:NitT/TauT family transport system permease protein
MKHRVWWGVWLPALLLAVWQGLAMAGWLNPLFFPPPTAVFASAAELTRSGELPRHVLATCTRTGAGFLVGATAGLGLGLLMGGFRRVRGSVEPLLSALYSTPKLSLFPLLMLLLGVSDAARITIIALAATILTAMNTLDGVRNIDHGYVDMAVNYGAGRLDLFRCIYLPACLPQVFTGLRLALGRALVLAVSVELVSSSDGLGSMIWMAWQTFSTERLYVAVAVTAALGGLTHLAIHRLERRLIPWKAVDGDA